MSKTVLITGGTRGIGRATAETFINKGYNTVITYEKSEAIAKEMELMYPDRFMAVKCDVASPKDVARVFDTVKSRFGGADILINNAAISSHGLIQDVTDAEWDRMFDVNIKGMFNTVKCALPYMIGKKSGNIINLSSIWGISGASCEVAYSATKAAVIGFTKALAKELGPSGISVNAVAPGVVDTDMNSCCDHEAMDALREETPLGKIGTPEDIAKVITFLAEDGDSFMTGQVISPNGGFLI